MLCKKHPSRFEKIVLYHVENVIRSKFFNVYTVLTELRRCYPIADSMSAALVRGSFTKCTIMHCEQMD